VSRLNICRTIEAPVEVVFATVADIRNFSKAIDHITNVEFLTESRTGVGTRFRETRIMKGKEVDTELKVTEYAENDHIRLVADEGGTIWDTLFRVRQEGTSTILEMTMDSRPHRLIAKFVNPLIRGMVRNAVEQDMDAVKEYCENLG